MSGWAIPEDKAADILRELRVIREEFQAATEQFLTEYDQTIQDWIAKHAAWGNIIAGSVDSPAHVRSRMSFRWQMYKVAPLETHTDNDPVNAGLAEEVENLGSTLFNEVSRTADEIWHRVYIGKTEVTHKALSPLRTLHNKLMGLSFVEPHIAPVADIVQMAMQRVPKKGNITGNDLLTLQGVVCLLRDTKALLLHAEKVISGYGPATVLDTVLAGAQSSATLVSPESVEDSDSEEAEPQFDVASIPPAAHIPSMGLW
jgi:hypothetical protein